MSPATMLVGTASQTDIEVHQTLPRTPGAGSSVPTR